METFKDEIGNLKAISRVIAISVLINFVIIAILQSPDAVGFDPLYGTITAILNFVIAFLTTGLLMGIYVVFDVKKTFDLSHLHNILFVAVTVQMLFALGSVFTYNSVFETVLDADSIGAVSGSLTNTIFFNPFKDKFSPRAFSGIAPKPRNNSPLFGFLSFSLSLHTGA